MLAHYPPQGQQGGGGEGARRRPRRAPPPLPQTALLQSVFVPGGSVGGGGSGVEEELTLEPWAALAARDATALATACSADPLCRGFSVGGSDGTSDATGSAIDAPPIDAATVEAGGLLRMRAVGVGGGSGDTAAAAGAAAGAGVAGTRAAAGAAATAAVATPAKAAASLKSLVDTRHTAADDERRRAADEAAAATTTAAAAGGGDGFGAKPMAGGRMTARAQRPPGRLAARLGKWLVAALFVTAACPHTARVGRLGGATTGSSGCV